MRRRLQALRRLDPRTSPPETPSGPDAAPDAPVAWAEEEPTPAEDAGPARPPGDATAEPGGTGGSIAVPGPDEAGRPTAAAEAGEAAGGEEEPATTVIPTVSEPDGSAAPDDSSNVPGPPVADEPETTAFAPVPPPPSTSEPAADSPADPAPAPRDAVAAPPLDVLGVQPDGTVLPAPDPSAPAGIEPGTATAEEPSFRVRGRLRRRMRYLRRVRELGLRDLGGLVFDLHRFQREGEVLVAGKLAALGAVDEELRSLEEALNDRHELTVLREPGLAACPRCAALHGSDANFCPNCGLPFSSGVPATGSGAPPVDAAFPPPGAGSHEVTAAHPRLDARGRPA